MEKVVGYKEFVTLQVIEGSPQQDSCCMSHTWNTHTLIISFKKHATLSMFRELLSELTDLPKNYHDIIVSTYLPSCDGAAKEEFAEQDAKLRAESKDKEEKIEALVKQIEELGGNIGYLSYAKYSTPNEWVDEDRVDMTQTQIHVRFNEISDFHTYLQPFLNIM